jgi:hypothetical protein
MHYAAELIQLDRTRSYAQDEPSTFGKPRGLWVSVQGEDDWPSWCRDEDHYLNGLRYAHRVTLVDRPNTLSVATPLGMDGLTSCYGTQTGWDRRWDHRRDNRAKWPIDWRQVAEMYGGIIIAPYFYQYRYSHDWYYGWDCASGCIWDLSVIESFEQVVGLVDAR